MSFNASLDITSNLQLIRQEIKASALKSNRNPSEIKLIAVSKKKPIEAIECALANAQIDFAENYPKELAEKAEKLKAKKIIWHFIGQIQSNKTKEIATYANWVHSVSSLKAASRLNQHSQELNKSLNVCIQINLLNEVQKGGISEDELFDFATEIIQLEHLNLRGVMFIPPIDLTLAELKTAFLKIQAIGQNLQSKLTNQNLDTFSFGMSGDYKIAIECGSTAIRIGSAIFGER